MLAYDSRGRCIEVENWSAGFREDLLIVCPGDGKGPGYQIDFNYIEPESCHLRSAVLDRFGRQLATVLADMKMDGVQELNGTLSPELVSHCDSQGKIDGETRLDIKGRAYRSRAWTFDGSSRITRVRDTSGQMPLCTIDYWHDSSSRVME